MTQQSNVREVLASLDDPAETREMPSPPPVNVPVARPAPAPAPRAAATNAGTQSMRARSAPEPEDSTLTDTQVLRILEDRRADGSPGGRNEEHSTITLLRPDDTGTRRALKEAVQQRAPVSFAVQLMWSVQPIDLAKVPPLAIFSAYTLYTVEGSREGRRWYGLRLGFFSDAISAKQVAYYVRSEFASVAVVPVSPQERERATQETSAAALMQARKPQQPQVEEFKLIDDDEPPRAAPAELSSAPAEPEKAQEPAARSAPKTPASRTAGTRRAGRGGDGRVNARKRRPPQTLEETLEILGAHELEIDDGRDTVSETGVRHLKVEVRRNTPFSRLLDRLTERISRS